MIARGLHAVLLSVLLMTTLLTVTGMIRGEGILLDAEISSETPSPGNTGGFTENLGQWPEEILFSARTGYGQIGLGKDRIYYNIMDIPSLQPDGPMRSVKKDDTIVRGSVVKVRFDDARDIRPEGNDLLPGTSNFFLGNDRERWAGGARSFGTVVYTDIWEGIDLVFRSAGETVKYDIYLDPGADASRIGFIVEGHTSLAVVDNDLRIGTGIGISITDSGLVACYTDGKGESIDVDFRIHDEDSYTIVLKGRDPERGVLIDPIVYSSYLGGNDEDYAYFCDVDTSGNTYMTGFTASTNFPTTTGAYQTTLAAILDVFVTKVDQSATAVVFSSYLGGAQMDYGYSIKVDGYGDVYVAGSSYSLDFPTTPGAYNETHWNSSDFTDVIVFKLSSNGATLSYSTYVAGSQDDEAWCLDIDGSGNAYVVGTSYSTDFPTTSDAYDTTGDDWGEIIFFKLSSKGDSLEYSTFFGGVESESGYGIEYDGSGNVYITGSSWSRDFPTTSGAYQQTIQGWTDVVVLKLNVDRSTLIYSTFIGGDDEEEGTAITVDSSGNAFVTGYTWGGMSVMFPTTTGAYSTSYGGGTWDAFALKLNSAGTSLIYSTFLGGSVDETGVRIDIDKAGKAYICGYTDSTNFPTVPGADYTSSRGSLDGFVTVVNPTGSSLTYSSYLGGTSDEIATGIYVDAMNEAHVVGITDSANFPTTSGVISTTKAQGADCFLTKLNFTLPPGLPRSLAATPGDDHIDLTWSAPLSDGGWPITKYTIHKRVDGDPDTETVNLTATNYRDSNVSVGVKYMYSVSASNMWKEGPRTSEVGAMVTSAPLPPINLTAVTTVGRVELDWEAPEFNGGTMLTNYKVYKGTESGDLDLLVELSAVGTAYIDTDVQPGVAYFYQVTAVNMKGESEPSEEISTTLPDIPQHPKNFSATAGNEYVYLSWEEPEWDGGTPIKSYKLYKGTSPETYSLLKTVSSGARAYNDTKVTNGMFYYYHISAVNDVGESKLIANTSANPGTVPTAPTLYEAEVGDGSLRLTWEAQGSDGGSPVTSLRLYWGTAEDDLEVLEELEPSESEFLHEGLTNGQEYFYEISALNSWGESPRSNDISAIPLGLPDPPGSLEAMGGDGFVKLSWEPPVDTGGAMIANYHIFRAVDSGDPIHHKIVSTTNYNDTDVINGKTYHYSLTAVNIIGESIRTQEVSAQPLGLPDAPLNFVYLVGDGQVDLSWQAAGDTGGSPLLSFRLYRSTDNIEFQLLAEVGSEVTGHRDTEVDNGVVYYYRLTAKNLQGESEFSETISAMPFGIPSNPMNVQVMEQDGMIVITWELPQDDGGSPLTHIRVYRARDEGMEQMIANLDGDATTYTDRNVIEGSRYTYSIKAENAAGESINLETYSIEIEKPKEGSNFGLILGIIIAIVVLMVILVITLYLVVFRKKEAREEQPPFPPGYQGYPPPGQQLPGAAAPTGQLYGSPGYQQIPGYAPGQQAGLPSAYPSQQGYEAPLEQNAQQVSQGALETPELGIVQQEPMEQGYTPEEYQGAPINDTYGEQNVEPSAEHFMGEVSEPVPEPFRGEGATIPEEGEGPSISDEVQPRQGPPEPSGSPEENEIPPGEEVPQEER
ncbi:MAG: fibronectin type III domain-containing protein [Thermoplasmatota archaeon]